MSRKTWIHKSSFKLSRSCALLGAAMPPPRFSDLPRQEEDDETRRLWNKQFLKARGGAGKPWTQAEQEADGGKRKLVQSDPLPKTIYRVWTKSGGCALVTVPLRIAP